MLSGGAKDDMIVGGLGADTLDGYGGNDWFLYRDAAESNSAGADTLYDFDAGDWIDLSAIDADSTRAGNDPFAFIGSDDFHHVAGELRAVFDGAWWSVEGDIDGDGVADFVLAISTANGHMLGVADFTL
jgi:Ca2+-binding RTX toxin-like protein